MYHPREDTSYRMYHPREGTPYITYHPREGTSYRMYHPGDGTSYRMYHPREGTSYTKCIVQWSDILVPLKLAHACTTQKHIICEIQKYIIFLYKKYVTHNLLYLNNFSPIHSHIYYYNVQRIANTFIDFLHIQTIYFILTLIFISFWHTKKRLKWLHYSKYEQNSTTYWLPVLG